jgi:hypothetical protein
VRFTKVIDVDLSFTEPITVEVAFRNPLKVPLLLTDLSLLWKFHPKDVSGKDNEEVRELVSY